MGLLSDTNMHTDRFSNLTLAFYVTYLFFEIPTGFLMQRLPTAKCSGVQWWVMVHDFDIWCTDPLVTIWGLTTTLNCTAKNFPGLMVLRVLLGCFELAIAPAYVHSPRTLFRPLLISFQIDPDHIDVVQKRRTTPKNGNMVHIAINMEEQHPAHTPTTNTPIPTPRGIGEIPMRHSPTGINHYLPKTRFQHLTDHGKAIQTRRGNKFTSPLPGSQSTGGFSRSVQVKLGSSNATAVYQWTGF
ncbi:unnamed protein product [Penicillium viridicatum]